jgi:hypothetical protein
MFLKATKRDEFPHPAPVDSGGRTGKHGQSVDRYGRDLRGFLHAGRSVGLAAARSGQYLRDDDRQQGAAEAAAGG